MKAEYRICSGKILDEEGNIHTTYGVELWQSRVKSRCIPDVSLDREGVAELVRLCNELELSPTHLDDVIEDYMN